MIDTILIALSVLVLSITLTVSAFVYIINLPLAYYLLPIMFACFYLVESLSQPKYWRGV